MNNYISGTHQFGQFFISNNIASNLLLNSNSLITIENDAQISGLLINNGAYIVAIQPQRIEHKYVEYLSNNAKMLSAQAETIHNCIPTFVSGSDINTSQQFYISNGIASGLTLYNNAIVYCNSASQIYDTTINYGGTMHVFNGASIINTTVNSGGSLIIYEGGNVKNYTSNIGAIILSTGINITDN